MKDVLKKFQAAMSEKNDARAKEALAWAMSPGAGMFYDRKGDYLRTEGHGDLFTPEVLLMAKEWLKGEK